MAKKQKVVQINQVVKFKNAVSLNRILYEKNRSYIKSVILKIFNVEEKKNSIIRYIL